jgi:TrmH family RNA methyltransferase
MLITSLNNEKIKEYIKLKDKKYRKINNLFIIEGEHLVKEAYKKGLLKELILLDDTKLDLDIDVDTIYVTKEIINKITDLETSPNILGICKIANNDKLVGNKYLILDNIQDPGNLGTIIRSAKAFNIDTIILSKDTVDLYNPKVVRATQGIMFHINIVITDIEYIINELKKKGIKIFGTDVKNGMTPSSIPSIDKDKFALVMGNEGSGVKEEIKKLCDDNLYIKMNNEVESLNVAVATSIILYEFNRR